MVLIHSTSPSSIHTADIRVRYIGRHLTNVPASIQKQARGSSTGHGGGISGIGAFAASAAISYRDHENLGTLTPSGLSITFPALDNTLGAMLIGTGMSSILAGVFVHQVFRYFRRYPKDHWSSKATVSVLCLLDIVHEVLIVHTCYYYMVSHFFQPIVLLRGVWSLRLVIPTTGVISTISHIFFARRVVILARNRNVVVPVAVVSAILIGLELAFCAVATFAIFRDVTFTRFVDHSSWIISASLGTRVLTDSAISGAMVAMLRGSRTGFKRTDSILDVLMSFAINTGLVTSVVNLAAMIMAIVLPNALVYCAIYIVSSKLYSNSVLAVLNSRKPRNKVKTDNEGMGTSWLEMSDHIAAALKTDPDAEIAGKSTLDTPAKLRRPTPVNMLAQDTGMAGGPADFGGRLYQGDL